MMDHITVLYGQPPFGLVEIPATAQQVSPLMPGSAALEEMADGHVAGAIVYAPASTIERRYVLAQALRTLAVGATLTALARSDKGGSRIAAELENFGCNVTDHARKHHRIVTTTRPAELRAMDEALTAGGLQQQIYKINPLSPTKLQPVIPGSSRDPAKPHHRIPGQARDDSLSFVATTGASPTDKSAASGSESNPELLKSTFYTQPGVFSWDRIDAGSALLLKHLPPLRGIGADFGCGIGVLARAVLQSAAVTTLTLLDIDRRALAAAQKNIADTRASYIWADLRTPALPAASLDFVVMNPPFHDTGVEDQSLGQAFITQAAAALKPGGQLWLTANRHLPYEAHLAKLFSRVMQVDDADGFKIIHGEK